MANQYVGVLYDIVNDIVKERSPIIRATYDAALADAEQLVTDWNLNPDNRGDELDEYDCYVEIDGQINFN